MKDHYCHRSNGFVGDYFGHVGLPVKLPFISYIFYVVINVWCIFFQIGKFRITSVPAGTPLREVMRTAILNAGAHKDSYSMKEGMERIDAHIVKCTVQKLRPSVVTFYDLIAG